MLVRYRRKGKHSIFVIKSQVFSGPVPLGWDFHSIFQLLLPPPALDKTESLEGARIG